MTATIPDEKAAPSAYFLGGTIVLDHVAQTTAPPDGFQWHNAKWRCPAVYYRTIRPWLYEQNIRNNIPRWRELPLILNDNRDPHPYQAEALRAWQEAGRWGSVVLPTGAGKTFLALQAITACSVSTLVVVPTLDLLHQWYALLENAFGGPIGVWYGQEKRLEPITVTTYPSAWVQAELLGNQFKLLVFDEIHHLPAPSWHEIALMCAAPYRLGLTATYPDTPELAPKPPSYNPNQFSISPAALLDELVGPVVYRKQIDDLTGQQLAEYRTERLRIDLTPEERATYDTAYAAYTGYIREARLRESHGPYWWDEFTRRSAYEVEARRAKVAEMKLKEIVHQAQGKLDILDRLMREHRHRQMLIFTAHNRFAYRIARRYLVPVITHQTKAAERKAILDEFRAGTYEVIVTSKVLNEGVDVPEAKVAVVLGGSASAREYVQRLGRVLRKKGNAQATLFEIIARKTVDERIARQRRPK
ncbi:MAG: DEAD/DEAH box helicase family protein [Anaerolineaceae bacterium]|nr:DEAD/DEAH box helicase family protein [Anaerolineaceae bacterium]MCB9101057.1 DEAD/DEAH box helicase family protein [Anaerolineales bacterium]